VYSIFHLHEFCYFIFHIDDAFKLELKNKLLTSQASLLELVKKRITTSPLLREDLHVIFIDEAFTVTAARLDFLRLLLSEVCPQAVLCLVGDPGQIGPFIEKKKYSVKCPTSGDNLHVPSGMSITNSVSAIEEIVEPQNVCCLETQFRYQDDEDYKRMMKSIQEGKAAQCKSVVTSILDRSPAKLDRQTTTELEGCKMVATYASEHPGCVVITSTLLSKDLSGNPIAAEEITRRRSSLRNPKYRFGVHREILVSTLGADAINRYHVQSLVTSSNPLVIFEAHDGPGDISDHHFKEHPLEYRVELCQGVQVKSVMPIPLDDTDGCDCIPTSTVGIVKAVSAAEVVVEFYRGKCEPVTVTVRRVTFTMKAFLKPDEFTTPTDLTRENIPLVPCLAACTRSSQGITCSKALILGHDCFQPGEFATQISRLQTLLGVELVCLVNALDT
jgi:hypothetical protein